MTADEVEEYITQIAFSGATAFLEKYKDKTNKDEIIGHFGLGFLFRIHGFRQRGDRHPSFQKDASPVTGNVTGSSEYTIGDGTKTTVERKSPCT